MSSEARPRTAQLGRLTDAEGALVDEVLLTWFRAPHSYTGEDVIEISCHGSPVVLHHCLERTVANGARLAEPGEFTLRAFVHGKIDLLQAEAVRDLIDSTTLYQARIAAQQKQGALAARLQPAKQNLVDLISMLEAGIDFAEDDISVAPAAEILRRLDLISVNLDRLVKSFAWGRLVREGFTLAIVGPPNAGKSSLFNALLQQDRAIVTPIPGTTRDTISEQTEISGIPVRLLDTAGIRETEEPIEKLGIERSYEAIADATVALAVWDATLPKPKSLEEFGATLYVANKCDLPGVIIPSGAIGVSAFTGDGLDRLRQAILVALAPAGENLETGFVTSLRQKRLLEKAANFVQKAKMANFDNIPHEMILLDLYCALEPIDGLSGKTTAEDILRNIFSTFCIGK